MAKAVVIGLPGESGLWLADLEAGTVTKLDEAPAGDVATAAAWAAKGASIVKGVNFAVAVSSASEVAQSLHEG